VLFMLDMSGSIGTEGFKTMQNYVLEIAKVMDIKPNGATFLHLFNSRRCCAQFIMKIWPQKI
jgi:hypothetical protein